MSKMICKAKQARQSFTNGLYEVFGQDVLHSDPSNPASRATLYACSNSLLSKLLAWHVAIESLIPTNVMKHFAASDNLEL